MTETPEQPETDTTDPKFNELARFVLDQVWHLQARINVLEVVVQQLAISLAKHSDNPSAWLDSFMKILSRAADSGIADIPDPAAGQQMLQHTKKAMEVLLKDLARNGKRL